MGRKRRKRYKVKLPTGMRKRGKYYYSELMVGRDRSCVALGLDYRKAVRKHHELMELAERRRRGFRDNDVTIGVLYDLWMEDLKVHARASTVQAYEFKFRRLLRDPYGFAGGWTGFFSRDLRVQDLKHDHVTEYIRHCRAKERPAADRTVNSDIAALKRLLNWAALSHIESNPIEKAKNIERPVERKKAILTPSEFLALVDHRHCYGACRHKEVWLTFVLTGLRKGELEHVRWCDFDTDKRTIRVEPHDGWRPKNPKSIRTIPLSKRVFSALRARAWKANAEGWYGDQLPIFPKACHNLRRTFQACLRVADIQKGGVTIHSLRRTWDSWGLEAGASVKGLQQIGGWTSGLMPLDVYGQALPEAAKDAVRKIDAWLDSKLKRPFRPSSTVARGS